MHLSAYLLWFIPYPFSFFFSLLLLLQEFIQSMSLSHPFIIQSFGLFEVSETYIRHSCLFGDYLTKVTSLIVCIYTYILQTECCFSLVLQYAAGGELYTRMKSVARMPENCAKFYIGQLAMVLKYLHDNRIVYR